MNTRLLFLSSLLFSTILSAMDIKEELSKYPSSFPYKLVKEIRNGDFIKVRALVEMGEEIKCVSFQSLPGEGPMLNMALRLGHVDIAKYLFHKGAPHSEKDSDNKTALHRLARQGDNDGEFCKELIDAGTPINEIGFFQSTPLSIAMEELGQCNWKRVLPVWKALIEAKADPNMGKVYGKLAILEHAVYQNAVVRAEELISIGAAIKPTYLDDVTSEEMRTLLNRGSHL